jgi:hypothetical protein
MTSGAAFDGTPNDCGNSEMEPTAVVTPAALPVDNPFAAHAADDVNLRASGGSQESAPASTTTAAAAASPGDSSAVPCSKRKLPKGISLKEQVRLCEQRWVSDTLKVASGEVEPHEVSLVGIGDEPHRYVCSRHLGVRYGST